MAGLHADRHFLSNPENRVISKVTNFPHGVWLFGAPKTKSKCKEEFYKTKQVVRSWQMKFREIKVAQVKIILPLSITSWDLNWLELTVRFFSAVTNISIMISA